MKNLFHFGFDSDWGRFVFAGKDTVNTGLDATADMKSVPDSIPKGLEDYFKGVKQGEYFSRFN